MFAVALPFLLSGMIVAQEPVNATWQTDVNVAFKQSQATGKPLMLFFTADHCRYCVIMKQQTLDHPQVKSAIDQAFIPVLVHEKDNEVFCEKLGVKAFPTTMIVSPQAKILAIIGGYVKPADLRARLAASIKPTTTRR